MSEQPQISITKGQLADLPVVTFQGEITLIDNPEDVAEAVAVLSTHRILGFDTETRPSFRKGYANNVALLQLCADEHCYLFRLNRFGIDSSLKSLLENPDIIKIGLSIHDDFHVMHRSAEFEPRGFVELQEMVKPYGIQDISLQKIYAILFGEKISKSQRLTNWEADELTSKQQSYAATDAWACVRIYDYLTSGMFDPSTSPYIIPVPQPGDTDKTQD